MNNTIINAARVAHETMRAWCITQGDTTKKAWDELTDGERDVIYGDVKYLVETPGADEKSLHERWARNMSDGGWFPGEITDEHATPPTHALLVSFDDLSEELQIKDQLMFSVVQAMPRKTNISFSLYRKDDDPEERAALLTKALDVTNSEGWALDAWVLVALKDGEEAAIAVVQNFQHDAEYNETGGELHFGVLGKGVMTSRTILKGMHTFLMHRSFGNLAYLYAPIAEDNVAMIQVAKKSNYKDVGYLTSGARAQNRVKLFHVTRDDCRWLHTK